MMNYRFDTSDCQDTPSTRPLLYQPNPLRLELNRNLSHTKSATSSSESYKNFMRQLVYTLIHNCRLRNGRLKKISVQLNFQKEFDASRLNEITRKAHRYFRDQKSFVAFFVNEITTDGSQPVNRIHRHYIIDSATGIEAAGIEPTRQAFYIALSKAGLVHNVDYTLTVKKIKRTKGFVFYICKFGKKWEKDAILFAKNSGIPKYGVIGRFFLDEDSKESPTQSISKLYRLRKQYYHRRLRHIESHYPLIYQKLLFYNRYIRENWVDCLTEHCLLLLESRWQEIEMEKKLNTE